MLISLVMTRGEAKTYTIEFKPPEEQSDPLLDGIFPDSEWLAELPFNTDLLKFFISDRPLDDAQGVIKLPPIPFAKSTKNKTRFEMQNDRGRRLLSSKENPVTKQFLYNAAIDVSIIDEQKPIYIGVGPAEKPDDDDDQGDREREAAVEYLNAFVRQNVQFYKGSRLTSAQVLAAIESVAPDDIRTELIDRADITLAVKSRYGIVMEKEPTRIDGKSQKYWQDFGIALD